MSLNNSLSSASFNKVNEELIELTKNYFGVDEINTSKNTFLSYFIETLSNTIADTNLSAAFLFNEQMINSAKFKSNILKKARDYGYKPITAFPAYIETIIYIELTNKEIESKYGKLDILNIKDRDLKFNYYNISYSLLGDLIITKKDEKFNVELKTSKLASPLYNSFDINLKLANSVIEVDGKYYLAFSTELAQVEINYLEHYVSDRIFKTYYSIEFDLPNNLSLYDVNIYMYDNGNKIYLKRNEDAFINVEKYNYYFAIEEINNSKYAIILDNGINSKFINNGTKLYIETYATNGSKGFVSKPVFLVETNDTIVINRDIKADSPYISTKGIDELNDIELKKDIIRYIQTPENKTVVTEFDIKNVLDRLYLNNIEVNDIIMRRNDPIERILEVYTTIRTDNKLSFLGTNTLNLKVSESYLLDNNFFIKPNQIMRQDPNKEISDPIEITDTLDNNNYYNFTSNYNIEIITNPSLYASITQFNFFNKDFEVYENVNNSTLLNIDLYATKIYIDNSEENKFKFCANFYSSDMKYIKDLLNNNPTIADDLVFRIILQNSKDDTYDFYIDLKYDNSDEYKDLPFLVMTNTINATGIVHNNRLEYINGLTIINDNNEYLIKNNYDNIISFLFFKNRHSEIIDNNITENKSDLEKYLYNTSNINDCILVSRQNLISNNIFFTNLSEFFKIEVKKVLNENNEIEYILYNLPLINYNDYNSIENSTFIYNIQLEYLELYKYIKEIVEMPSALAVKYKNTYGKNDNYSITYIDGTTENSSRLKLNIELTIKDGYPSLTNEDYDKIRKNIMTFININENRNIYVSDIIDIVQNTIPYLLQVRLVNLNENIIYKPKKDSNGNYLYDYIPSIINITESDIQIYQKNYNK